MKRRPTHPGKLFKRNFLERRAISVTKAAEYLGITRKALSEFINENSKCSQSMARRLAEATGTGVAVWINLQAKLDTWEAEHMERPNVTKLPDEVAA
ncbi:HigA family addiction module antitoxin [uncultured Shewanella sp.]|uniref:HigA family addiction module antitoxin n=1 Tax=uncultured Shewanella sp. TaxID=173975 RepID=UPI0026182C2D|nr:HigA family addiction module antitoxin [uncultured Shewanella sp.]